MGRTHTISNKCQELAETPRKTKRMIKFNKVIEAFLIPTLQEYHDEDLVDRLWYSQQELAKYRVDARREKEEQQAEMDEMNSLESIMQAYKALSLKSQHQGGCPFGSSL